MKRPFIHMAIAFGAGIFVAWHIRQVFFLMIIFVILILLCIYCATKKIPLFKHLLLWAICLFCGYVNYAFQYQQLLLPFQPFYETDITISGYVNSDCIIEQDRAKFTLFAETVETLNEEKEVNRQILVYVYDAGQRSDYLPGTRITVSGKLSKPESSRNPGGFNYQSYLFSKKLSAVMWVDKNKILWDGSAKNVPLLRFGLEVRSRILFSLEKNLSYEKAALMAAMLTGYRENLTDEMEDAFSASGLIHIMAVSGANIAFLLIPLLWLFKMLALDRRVSALATIPFIFFYTLLTGIEASVLRASIMAVVIMVGKALDRKSDLLNSIGIASFVILLANPFMLFDAGFVLSVGATTGLALIYRKTLSIIPDKVPGFIGETLAATVSAQAGVLPLLIMYFSKISVVSLISNLLVIPITGIATVTGMICVIADSIHGIAGVYIGYILQGLLHAILYITEACGSVPWAEINMHHWSFWWILLYYFFVIIIGIYGSAFFIRYKSYVFILAFLIGVGLLVQNSLPGRLKVIFTDVGQGDSVLIQTVEGKNYMIDGGGTYNESKTGYIGNRVLLPLLMHEGVSRLDQIFVTHAHTDHMSGVITLIQDFPVDSVGIPDYPGALDDFCSLIELCDAKGIDVVFYTSGDRVFLDRRTTFDILNPDSEKNIDYTNLNNTSLCGMLCFEELDILFTGDIEIDAEQSLIRLPLDCDILKVSHHGGKNATSEEFIKHTSPEIAVISVGRNNFGHPSEEVLNRLLFYGSRIYKTFENGAVIIESDGHYFSVKSWYRDDKFSFFN
jgi:competence protein ComEC